jgi:hypothetical protein
MKAKLAVISLSLIIVAQPSLASAQGAQLSSDQAWDLVKQTPLGEKLEVKLKDGRSAKGEMILASDSELSLSLKNQQAAEFKRDEIREVRRVLPPDPDKQKLFAGIGVGIGLMAGLAIAISQAERYCGDCREEKVGVAVAMVALPVGGALIGRKLGGRGKRILIYQAP